MRRIVPVLVLLLLAGCANGLAQRQAYLSQFIGQPVSYLVQVAGVPNRTYTTNGIQYLAYTESRVEVIPGIPPYAWGPPFWGWYGGGFPPEVVNRICETTFAATDNIVRSYTLRGNACG